jgi:hypothetical protein
MVAAAARNLDVLIVPEATVLLAGGGMRYHGNSQRVAATYVTPPVVM